VVDGRMVAFGPDADWIRVAYLTLSPLLGATAASLLFAIALLASGQSSTLTGTLAGQVVMEGFLDLRLASWARRLVTRLTAIAPAVVVIALRGGGSINGLLVLSQVVLALQLPFAMFPLLWFTSRPRFMRRWRSGPVLLALGWASAILITALDCYGLPGALGDAWRLAAG
jgi:manganese transport protein